MRFLTSPIRQSRNRLLQISVGGRNSADKAEEGTMDEAKLNQIGEFLDTVMTLNVHFKFLKGDIIKKLYRKCKEILSIDNEPLSLFAAKDILANLHKGDTFLMITGWRVLPSGPFGEMDGPSGATVLAKAINQASQATPVFIVEEELDKVITDACRIVGMSVLDLEDALEAGNACSIIHYPMEDRKRKDIISKILQRTNPSYMVAIERPGMNEKGQYHFRWGASASRGVARVDYLFEEARRRKVRGLAIGDAGNELGMGKIKDALLEEFPEGKKCKCPCSGSIAGVVEADVTFLATVCNWGAYAITAGLAALKEDPAILHDGETERKILMRCAENGAVDTSIMAPRATPEALSTGFHSNIVEIIRETVGRGILGTSGL